MREGHVHKHPETPRETRVDGRTRSTSTGELRAYCATDAGVQGYYLLDGGPDVLITISMFDSVDEAIESNAKSADWVRNNVLEFTKGMPEVMIGSALIAEVR